MNAKLYTIHCLTNLHVGSGDVNFNIIDNEVERDPVTGYPTIHSSGVKGAFRSHFRGVGYGPMEELFGKANDKNNDGIYAGKLKFFSADMLAIPMRTSAGEKPYVLVTTQTAVEHLENLMQAILGRKLVVSEHKKPVSVEGKHCDLCKCVFGRELTVMPEADFAAMDLPVLARNCQETGKENLWYEEVVPHQSIFTLVVCGPDQALQAFGEVLKQNPIVQFGGNASIGYGVCKVQEV